MPYGIPNFAASLRETVAKSRRPRREIDPSEFELPASPAMDDFMAHSESGPVYEDYKPGFGGKLAAGLVGAAEGLNRGARAGVAAGREVMDRNFMEALRQHASSGRSLQMRAGLEKDRNETTLGLRKERRMAERSQDEIALQEEASDIADRQEARMREKMGVDDENMDLDRAARERVSGAEISSRRDVANIAANASRYAADREVDEAEKRGFGRGAAGAEKVIPIQQQGDADRQAIEMVIRNNPKYMKFVDEIAGKEDSDFKGYRIMPGTTVQNEDTWMPFEADEREMNPDEKRDYDAFVREVEDAKKQMYGTMVDPYARRGFGGGVR